MLRGRGGCYKHAFYGIESHRCMEATPSLACANKCVFCWRHHTNPGLSAGRTSQMSRFCFSQQCTRGPMLYGLSGQAGFCCPIYATLCIGTTPCTCPLRALMPHYILIVPC